jgi:HlyD family type I secretion membrane fusion protein
MNPHLPSLFLPPADPAAGRRPSTSLKGSVIAGVAVIIAAFGGFGTWAALAPLDSAVVARGELSVESNRKTVQHREGGIVREILVKNGDSVTAGQVLIRLADARAESGFDSLRGQYQAALAELVRLQAERDGLAGIAFPAQLLHGDEQARAVMAAQNSRFDERRKRLSAQTSVLEQRIAELNEEIHGYQVQAEALTRQIDLSHKELNGLKELADMGYYPKNKLLAMERDIARLEGERGAQNAAEARARKTISETEMQLVEVRHTFREEVVKDLDQAQNKLNELREQVSAADDQVHRLEVVAPVAGTVQNLKVATIGGVIAAGADIMDIVPADDRLVIDARVQANDIEAVEADRPAEVRFSALRGRNSPVLEGKVLTVSADHLTDQRTGQPYYAARIEVPNEQLARLDGRHIQPGMPVEVLVKGGERTALDYMLRPVTDSFATSFKER